MGNPFERQRDAADPNNHYADFGPGDRMFGSDMQIAKADVPVRQTDQTNAPDVIAGVIDHAAKTGNYAVAMRILSNTAAQAFETGGIGDVYHLMKEVNENVDTKGIGPKLVERGGRLEIHIVDQRQGGERDLVGPALLDTRRAISTVDALGSVSNVLRSGRMNDEVAAELEKQMRIHANNLPEFQKSLNDEIAKRGFLIRFDLKLLQNQPGGFGGRESMNDYTVTVLDGRNNLVHGFRSRWDTVRSIGQASGQGRQWKP